MLDKTALGNRYLCFKCGTKFYDLNRPVPLCPECEADQREAPIRDIRSLLSGTTTRAIVKEPAPVPAPPVEEDESTEVEEAPAEEEDGAEEELGIPEMPSP
ncbi:MAG: TIGR02300 family protein [Proteobacteria bacterium]|jgi:hypothetical protein|nr:TIGR02300 family protein [Pseudomonadota bacterium]